MDDFNSKNKKQKRKQKYIIIFHQIHSRGGVLLPELQREVYNENVGLAETGLKAGLLEDVEAALLDDSICC